MEELGSGWKVRSREENVDAWGCLCPVHSFPATPAVPERSSPLKQGHRDEATGGAEGVPCPQAAQDGGG